MDKEDMIGRFVKFLREYTDDSGNKIYLDEIRDVLTVVPRRYIGISWEHLNAFDPELAGELIDNPEEVILAAEDAIQIVLQEDFFRKEPFLIHARFHGLPKSYLVKELGSEHINKFIQVEGIITRMTEVKPFVSRAVYICKDCGHEMVRLQKPYATLVKPNKCEACGSRNVELDVDKSTFLNFQSFRLQDRPESLKGGQMPRFVDVILLDDLVDIALPGDRVIITGILRVVLEQRDKRPIFRKIIEANYVEQLSKEIEELEITPEDEQKIKELAKRKDIVDVIVDSIAPAIYGMKKEKLGIALALFGGNTRQLPDGTRLRGESHVLLVGDPGVAKCVDYHTKVLLADGSLREIGEVIEEAIERARAEGKLRRVDDGFYAPIDLELYALDAKTLKIRKVRANIAWKRTAPERMFKIKTASGREIRVTPTHPFFTFENGQFKTRKAKELRVGDFIAVPRKENEPKTVPKTEDEHLRKLLEDSDIFWDRVVEIEEYKPEHKWVYDLQVPEHHNFIANDIFVHNSQLLRYVANLAPRAIYTSGKSSSAAGLCVAPDSIIETNMGEFEIGSLVDKVIPEDVTDNKSVDAGSLGLTVRTKDGMKKVLRLWKLKAPKELVRIRAEDGREIIVTPETRLLTPEGWKQAKDITGQVMTDKGPVKATAERISSPYDYVYDLTVEGSHSFVANGFVVHNTAAAVRDELTGSWVLEAGVLVLADGGFACLHPDSRVLVNGKYVRIEDLFELEKSYKALSDGQVVDIQEKEMEVTTLDLASMKTKASKATIIRRKPWKGELVRLKFRSGNEVTLTPDHLLIDGQALEWKEAEKFKVGDRVVAPLKLPPVKDKVYILDILPADWKVKLTPEEKTELKTEILKRFKSLAKFNRKHGISRDFLSGKGSISVGKFREILRELGLYERWRERPLTYGPNYRRERLKVAYITPELAYFLGFLYGDGWIRRNGSKVHVRIVQSKVHEDQINRIRKAFTSFYEGELREYERTTRSKLAGNEIKSDSITFHVSSPLLAYLYEYITKDNLRNAFSLDDEALKAFVAGALDSDGCVSVKKSKKGSVVHVEFLLSNDLERDRAFALLLRRFDVYARVIPGKSVNKIRVTGREDVENLLSAIKEYSVKVKEVPLKKHLVSSRSDKVPAEPVKRIAKSIIESVPAKILQERGLWSTVYSYAKGKYQPSRIQLRKLVERLDDVLHPEIKLKLEVLSTRDYFLDEIVSIERVPYKGYVYDLYVPGEHNFLAEGIIVHNCIDEIDKMSDRDRSSIHEALEQQSYHRDFEILLADGRKVKIGELVDSLIEANRDKVILGKDTEILPIDEIELLAYDLERKEIVKVKADRVSRHKAPEKFIRLKFSNGREITVTPEHPIMVWEKGKIREKPAEKIRPGDLVLAVRRYTPMEGKNFDETTAKFLGFLLSEGFTYANPSNSYYEVGFTNTDERIVEEFKGLLKKLGAKYAIQIRERAGGKKLYTVRTISKDFYLKLKEEFPEVFPEKSNERPARRKRLPTKILEANERAKKAFPNAFFKGDGFVDKYRVGLTTSSKAMAEDLQDVLLSLGIYSYIFEERRGKTTYYKVIVSGMEDIERFAEIVGDDPRITRIEQLLKTSRKKRNYRDVIPTEVLEELRVVLNSLHINDGRLTKNIKARQNANRERVQEYVKKAGKKIAELKDAIERRDVERIRGFVTVRELSKRINVPYSTVLYRLKRKHEETVKVLAELANEKLRKAEKKLAEIRTIVEGNLRFLRVTKIEELPNDRWEWVYDVTVEPYHLFVSHGLVLHNTVSISKAGITATLNARTTVIAAANPKYGRFNRMKSLPEQVDLPPTLLSRFDLLFVLLDEPDEKLDSEIAEHILKVRKGEAETVAPKIPHELLKKYIAYARKNIKPVLSKEAMEEIKRYYVKMRRTIGRGGNEEGIKPIPITARQLEALIRLSEAHAKMRLSEIVTKEDARAAIELMEYTLRKTAMDEEGNIDVSILEVGKSSKKINKMDKILSIIKELQDLEDYGAPREEIIKEASRYGIGKSEVEKILEELKANSMIYEPRSGYYKVL